MEGKMKVRISNKLVGNLELINLEDKCTEEITSYEEYCEIKLMDGLTIMATDVSLLLTYKGQHTLFTNRLDISLPDSPYMATQEMPEFMKEYYIADYMYRYRFLFGNDLVIISFSMENPLPEDGHFIKKIDIMRMH